MTFSISVIQGTIKTLKINNFNLKILNEKFLSLSGVQPCCVLVSTVARFSFDNVAVTSAPSLDHLACPAPHSGHYTPHCTVHSQYSTYTTGWIKKLVFWAHFNANQTNPHLFFIHPVLSMLPVCIFWPNVNRWIVTDVMLWICLEIVV